MGRELFKTDWGKGDQPSAAEQNRVGLTLNRLTSQAPSSQTRYSRIRLIKMKAVSGKFESSPDLAGDTDSAVMFYSADSETYEENTENERSNTKDALGLVYDEDEILFAFFCEQSGKNYPINPRMVRNAVTVAVPAEDEEDDPEYPTAASKPDTYAFKFVKLTFTEAAGRQNHSMEYLDETDGPDGFVHSIIPPDLSIAYLPETTLIQIYNVNGQWFTQSSSLCRE